MSKAVLISILPNWVEKICSGEKTIEVRRTRPKIETPFKCYIYCLKGKTFLYKNPNNGELFLDSNGGYRGGDYEDRFLTGKVIGSFVCDRVRLCIPFGLKGHLLSQEVYREMCLTKEQLDKYGGLKTLYGWHITEPKLFDKPRDITEFAIFGKCADECSEYDFCAREIAEDRMTCKYFKRTFLNRPPQSWCYVEA